MITSSHEGYPGQLISCHPFVWPLRPPLRLDRVMFPAPRARALKAGREGHRRRRCGLDRASTALGQLGRLRSRLSPRRWYTLPRICPAIDKWNPRAAWRGETPLGSGKSRRSTIIRLPRTRQLTNWLLSAIPIQIGDGARNCGQSARAVLSKHRNELVLLIFPGNFSRSSAAPDDGGAGRC
jgi:hypothetical protein